MQQHCDLLQFLEALLGQLGHGGLLFGEWYQQWRQVLQIPLLLYVLVQYLQLDTTERGSQCLWEHENTTDYFLQTVRAPTGHSHCWLTMKSCRTLPPPHVWSAFRSGANTEMLALLYLGKMLLCAFITLYQRRTRNVENICDERATFTDHGVTQNVGGLAQFVFGDSAVEQDGLQQAGVVQVNVIVPFLQSQTHTHTFNPLSCNYSQKQEHYCTMSASVNNDCCVRLPSHSVWLTYS